MNLFIDTSAFLAILNANDRFHEPAQRTWFEILSSDAVLYSSNYVILETSTLLQHRFGLDAVRLFETSVVPVIEIIWVDEAIHKQAVSALLVANRRNLSLVDCTSFDVMRKFSLEIAFSFDPHFQEQGFTVIPPLTGIDTVKQDQD
jgi:predicted nucleic acid-binding protein